MDFAVGALCAVLSMLIFERRGALYWRLRGLSPRVQIGDVRFIPKGDGIHVFERYAPDKWVELTILPPRFHKDLDRGLEAALAKLRDEFAFQNRQSITSKPS